MFQCYQNNYETLLKFTTFKNRLIEIKILVNAKIAIRYKHTHIMSDMLSYKCGHTYIYTHVFYHLRSTDTY